MNATILRSPLDQATARQLFSYNPDSGLLTWRKSPANSVKAGWEAGTLKKCRSGKIYRRVVIKGYGYPYAHRIIWVIVTGHWPAKPEEIDHIDGNGLNNRWNNLRLVSGRSEQLRNVRLYANNTTGYVGVSFHKPSGKYRARVQVDGRQHYLGHFTLLEEAIAARKAASVAHGFHPNHGQERPL